MPLEDTLAVVAQPAPQGTPLDPVGSRFHGISPLAMCLKEHPAWLVWVPYCTHVYCLLHLHSKNMLQVGPGVKDLAEGDVVVTQQPLMGTWREAAVWPAKQLLKVGTRPAAAAAPHTAAATSAPAGSAAGDSQGQGGGEAGAPGGQAEQAGAGGSRGEGAVWEEVLPLPLEYLAVSRELLVAYQLLAEHGDLKVRRC